RSSPCTGFSRDGPAVRVQPCLDVDADQAAIAAVRVRPVDLNHGKGPGLPDGLEGLGDLGRQALKSDFPTPHPPGTLCPPFRTAVGSSVSIPEMSWILGRITVGPGQGWAESGS